MNTQISKRRLIWPLLLVASLTTATSWAESGTPGQLKAPQCPSSARHYGKNLLVTHFPRRELSSANIGRLHQVEATLPTLLSERLSESAGIAQNQRLETALPDQRSLQEPELAQQVRKLAQDHKAHLVLSGEILDMSMANPRDSYKPTLVNRMRNGLVSLFRLDPARDTRLRHFVFEATLRDGITGETLARRQYQSRGVWGPDRPHRVGFGSPSFWETDYGQQVDELIQYASAELEKIIRCQPLAATLDLKGGVDHVVVHSGTDQGVKQGDTLRLYQVITRPVPGEYQLYRTHLLDSKTKLQIKESYPSYSVAEIHQDLALRHGQYVALASGAQPEPARGSTVRVFIPPPDTNR